ncbi:MAG: glycosyltransferase family 4 protein [Gammaproteobacteria bacterium]|nr:glycosyltransferase family 4 protein [Gammaproteobacteria bacterium]
MDVLLDNIIFELQVVGGISALWGYHLENILNEEVVHDDVTVKFVEGPAASANIFRSKIHVPDESLLADRSWPLKIRRYLAVPEIPVDIFHSSYFRVGPKKSKQVVTVHDLMYYRFDSGMRKFVFKMQFERALRNADAIVCVSEHTKADLLLYCPWVAKKKITVIYNGADTAFFPSASKNEVLNLPGCNLKRSSYLLYVGSRGYCKNFPMAVAMAASEFARDLDLRLVCVGGGQFNQQEQELLSKSALQDRVILLQGVSTDQLNLLYNNAYCLLFPSLYEGFGIPALEAMRAGCLVLPACSSSIPEIVGDSDFYYEPGDCVVANSALERTADKGLVQKQVRYGIVRSSNFGWDKMSQELFKLYFSL